MEKIDHIELYVANLPQAVHFYKTAFQFIPTAHFQSSSQSSVLLQQTNDILIVLTSTTDPNSEIAKHIQIHGDGVKDIAFSTQNLDEDYESATKKGAVSILKPTTFEEGGNVIRKAAVKAFGNTTHSFIERNTKEPYFLPNYQRLDYSMHEKSKSPLRAIDHIAICIEPGQLSQWVEHYENIYNFHTTHDEYVETEKSGMKSKVVQSRNGNIKFVFVEPLPGKMQSQVSEFLKSYGGPGVQHIAFLTEDIVTTVNSMRNTGVNFLSIPSAYYETKKEKVDCNNNQLNLLQELSILFDKSQSGCLYQAFTKPISSRPTLFFEMIERSNSDGFGSDNIKALFKAIERDQLTRET